MSYAVPACPHAEYVFVPVKVYGYRQVYGFLSRLTAGRII